MVQDLRLCRFFGLSDGWWLALQTRYDLAMACEKIAAKLANIQRLSLGWTLPKTVTGRCSGSHLTCFLAQIKCK